MTRPRYTLEELLAQCDPNAPRSEEEQAWLDARPIGREFGAVRVLPISRVRRELNSIMRRGETVIVTRRGESMAKLEPIVTIEQMNEAIRRRGASAGVLAHVEADPNVTDDESLAFLATPCASHPPGLVAMGLARDMPAIARVCAFVRGSKPTSAG